MRAMEDDEYIYAQLYLQVITHVSCKVLRELI